MSVETFAYNLDKTLFHEKQKCVEQVIHSYTYLQRTSLDAQSM